MPVRELSRAQPDTLVDVHGVVDGVELQSRYVKPMDGGNLPYVG